MGFEDKRCFKCGKEKPISEFYRHKQMADGHLNKCKSCACNDVWEHRRKPEFRSKILEYDRKRGNRQDEEYRNAHRERFPTATKARNAVSNAVRDGKLDKPDRCQHCSVVCKPHGHHEDYTKPLEVVWLCASCHRTLHALYETVGREPVKRYG